MSIRRLAIASMVLSSAGCSLVLGLDISFEGGGGAGGSGAETAGAGGGATGPGAGGQGAGEPGGGGQGGGQGGGGGAPSAVCLDDEFDAAPGACWSGVLNAGVADVSASKGELHINIDTGSPSWAYDEQSYLLYRDVDGPFAVVASVRTTDLTGASDPSNGEYKVAGILVQDANTENTWEKLEVGLLAKGALGVISGHTLEGDTALDQRADFDLNAVLGFCRDGDTQIMMFKAPGDPAFQLLTHDGKAADYSDPLRVGIFAGVFTGSPDVSGHFDYVRLRNEPGLSVATENECSNVLEALSETELSAECACD